jgi:hypothetical protein
MTIPFSILNRDQLVVRVGRCEPDDFELQAGAGERVVLGHLPLMHVVQPDGSCAQLPQGSASVDTTPQFVRERRAAYPSVGEQLDMLWHAMDRGEIPKAIEWFERIAAVKAMHPKAVSDSGVEDLR